MSKKLKKLLLFSAVVGSAVGAVCYFSKKKNAVQEEPEEDYDDFSVDLESDSSGSGSYVPRITAGGTGAPRMPFTRISSG